MADQRPDAKGLQPWQRYRALHDELGGHGVLALHVLARLLERVSAGHARIVAYAFVAQPIGVGAFAAVRRDARTRIALLDREAARHAPLPRPAQVIEHRYASGATCHAAHVGEEFAGYIWICRDLYDEDEVRCRYVLTDAARCVWDYDVYIEPRHRLGRTMARLWKAVDEALERDGVRWSISRISLFNRASLSSHARLGARRIGSGVFVVAGRVQLSLFSRAPFLHLGWNARHVPRLALAAPAPEAGAASER